MKRLITPLIVVFCLLSAPDGRRAPAPSTALLEGAKKEGELAFYSGIFETEARAVRRRRWLVDAGGSAVVLAAIGVVVIWQLQS